MASETKNVAKAEGENAGSDGATGLGRLKASLRKAAGYVKQGAVYLIPTTLYGSAVLAAKGAIADPTRNVWQDTGAYNIPLGGAQTIDGCNINYYIQNGNISGFHLSGGPGEPWYYNLAPGANFTNGNGAYGCADGGADTIKVHLNGASNGVANIEVYRQVTQGWGDVWLVLAVAGAVLGTIALVGIASDHQSRKLLRDSPYQDANAF